MHGLKATGLLKLADFAGKLETGKAKKSYMCTNRSSNEHIGQHARCGLWILSLARQAHMFGQWNIKITC